MPTNCTLWPTPRKQWRLRTTWVIAKHMISCWTLNIKTVQEQKAVKLMNDFNILVLPLQLRSNEDTVLSIFWANNFDENLEKKLVVVQWKWWLLWHSKKFLIMSLALNTKSASSTYYFIAWKFRGFAVELKKPRN